MRLPTSEIRLGGNVGCTYNNVPSNSTTKLDLSEWTGFIISILSVNRDLYVVFAENDTRDIDTTLGLPMGSKDVPRIVPKGYDSAVMFRVPERLPWLYLQSRAANTDVYITVESDRVY